jgi:DNA repair photolyase
MIKKIDIYLTDNFPRLGINKKREIKRLLFEIIKRDNLPIEDILNTKTSSFEQIKKLLLKKRYPSTYKTHKTNNFYLPALDISKDLELHHKKITYSPTNIYIEKKSLKSELVERVRKLFPLAKFENIENIRDYSKRNKYTLKDYSKRQKNLFIINENYDFFKKCPCTKSVVRCGYHVLNLGFGCPFECSYCFLQEYQNFSGIALPSNIDDFLNILAVKMKSFKGLWRMGSGEFSDSLALDNISEYSKKIVPFFSKYPNAYFEFKTKSSEIKNLLNMKPAKNIIVSWSVNPKTIVDSNEFYSANLQERIDSAKECSDAGYGIGFHFDPIIYYAGWEKDYQQTIKTIFSKINPDKIHWISLGTLRFNPELKKIIENRFPSSKILDEELIIDFDGKMRYPDYIRTDIYIKMTKFLEDAGLKKEKIYLCMENSAMWKKIDLKLNKNWYQ